MKLETGQYHGTDLADVPTDYLEWAISHLQMNEDTEQAVVAEYARRQNAARVENETPSERLRERAGQAVTKFAAKHGL